MAEEAKKNELSALRAEYKAIVGKNPSPRLNADGLRAKIAELKAAPAADEKPADDAPAAEAEAAPAAAEAAAPAPPEAPRGTALLDHDDADASASYNGVEIVRGKNKLFLAPLGAVEDLQSHGFRLVGSGD